jgi:hypothetical protein
MHEQDYIREFKGLSEIKQDPHIRILCHQIPWIIEPNYLNTFGIVQEYSDTEQRAYIPGALYDNGKPISVGFYNVAVPIASLLGIVPLMFIQLFFPMNVVLILVISLTSTYP